MADGEKNEVEEKEEKEEVKEEKSESGSPNPILLGLVALVILAAIGAVYYFVVLSKSFKEARDLNIPAVEETMETEEEAAKENNAIAVVNFAPGDTVEIDLVALEKDGYVVVHEDNNGKPGEVIGISELLSADEHEDIEVELDRTSEEGETLYAMVYHDDGDEEFIQGKDLPATDIDEEFIMIPFEVIAGEEEVSEEAE